MHGSVLAELAHSTVIPAVADRQLFEDEAAYTRYLHEQSMLLDERNHQEEMRQAATLHQRKLDYASSLFVHDILMDLRLAKRDATRDAIRHCSMAVYTVMIADALILNCDFMLITQINLPTLVAPAFTATVLVITVATACSFVATFASVICSLRLQRAVAAYDASRPFRRYPCCGRMHEDYNEYYECGCERLETVSERWLVLGAGSTLVSAGAWAYANYVLSGLASMGPVVAFWLPCIVAGLVLGLGGSFLPDATRAGPRDFVGMPVDVRGLPEVSGLGKVDAADEAPV